MIEIICDKCQKNCELNAYVITVDTIHNPVPSHCCDTYGKPRLTDDDSSIRFCLCQKCYQKFGFPNIYTAIREKNLSWRTGEKNA